MVDLPLTGLDNRLLGPLLGRRLLPWLLRPPAWRQTAVSLDGAMRTYNGFIHYREVLVDFDSFPDRDDNSTKAPAHLTAPHTWTETPPPGLQKIAENSIPDGVQTHFNPVFWPRQLSPYNPSLYLDEVAALLDIAEFLEIPAEEITIWTKTFFTDTVLHSMTSTLFNAHPVPELRGKHWFRDLVCSHHLPRRILFHKAKDIRQHLLNAFEIPVRQRSEELRKITLISRQDYRWFNNRINVLTRKISNEEEIVASLRQHFPGTEVQLLRFEELPLREQLKQAHESDLLISMHGAGLGFIALMPENAAVLELFPACFTYPHYFKAFYSLSVCNNLHYRRWINLDPKREHCTEAWAEQLIGPQAKLLRMDPRRDFTRVPTGAVQRRVKALQRCIQRGTRHHQTPPPPPPPRAVKEN